MCIRDSFRASTVAGTASARPVAADSVSSRAVEAWVARSAEWREMCIRDSLHGARDGGGRQRQHVDGLAQVLQLLFVLHAKALLLVDDCLLYTSNNTPSDFTGRDNGSAWVAQTGATRYATLAGAFATAPDHSTIKLVSSVSEQPTLSLIHIYARAPSVQHPLGHPAGSDERLQPPLHRLLGRRVRTRVEPRDVYKRQ